MTTIVTRASKGSPLTWAEADANFTNLNTDKAELASPTLTGIPAAPTAAVGTNTTQLATTAFVNAEISNDAILKSGGTATGQIKGITPVSAEDLARKDYVDTMLPKTGGTLTGNLNVPSLNDGPLAGFRNKVINGAFNVWQRGTGPFTTTDKCADMWNLSWDGTGGTRSITRQTTTAGSEIENQFYYLQWVQTTAGTATYNTLEGLIEYARTFNGKDVTLSFWAKADAARTLTFFLRQVFGTGGSATVDTTTTNFSLTTNWQKFTYSFTVPSISGKTIGTDSKVALIFNMPLSAFTIEITNVQLEEGSLATPFEYRPISVEQSLCYRYLYAIPNNSNVYYQVLRRGANNEITLETPVELRTTPIPSGYPTANYGGFVGYNISGTNVSSGSGTGFGTIQKAGCSVLLVVTYTGWVGTEVHCGWGMTASSILLLSAEL